MAMKVAEAKKQIVGPAIRQQRKDAPARQRDMDDLQSLGIGKRQLPQLASKIRGLLKEQGWNVDAQVLKTTMQPGMRVGDLTRAIAKHALVMAPKKCANGHPQTYPGQTVCDLDGLRFQ
jgi:hypothetical protein